MTGGAGEASGYQRLVRQVFLEGTREAALRRMGTPWDEANLARNPHYVAALEAVADNGAPEDAAAALSAVADGIMEWAEANRGGAGWLDAALAMGWIRTAACRVWDVAPEPVKDRIPSP